MDSTDQSDKVEDSSSSAVGSIIGSIESDEEVARAFAAAVSVSKMSPAHKAEARTLQDEQQRALLEKHHSAALAKAQWEEHLNHPELIVKDAFQKITKHTPQEIEAVWKCKTKEMQHKLKELSSSLKLPVVQSAPLSILKPACASDVSTSSTTSNIGARLGNVSLLSHVQQSHIRYQPSWRDSTISLEKGKTSEIPFEINSAVNDADIERNSTMFRKDGDIVEFANSPAVGGDFGSVLTCNSTESFGHQESALPHENNISSTGSPGRNPSSSSYSQSDLPKESTSVSLAEPTVRVAEPSLTATVWKRREGLAKFSGKTSWERRKLVLQDTKLFYFAIETSDRIISPPRSRADSLDIVSAPSGTSEKGSIAPFALPVSSWIEHAAAALSIDLPTTFHNASVNSGDGTSPRGCLDLIKENATVAIVPPTSLSGQISGFPAPAPFCLAIKVEEKTKWKFCFDTHRQQIQWLVALSNVVVQHSVNEYISEQASKSPDGAKIICTVEHDFYVLKDRNEIVPTKETEDMDGDGLHKKRTQMTLSLEENYSASTDRNEFVANTEPKAVGANQSKQLFVSCANGVISIPLSSVYRLREFLMKMINIRSDETEQPSTRYPVIFYLIGDRLDLALCTANTAVIYIYCYSGSMHTINFVVLLWLFNTTLAFCCNIFIPRKESIARDKSSQLSDEGITDLDSAELRVEIPQRPSATAVKRYAFDSRAGSSTTKIASPDERKDGEICWMDVFPSDIMVRSIGYITSKKKIPSPGSLYECIAVDVLDGDRRIPDIGVKVNLDHVLIPGKELINQHKTWVSPEVFVVSVSLPTEAPRLGWATDDGAGIILIAYMRIKDDTREILRHITGNDASGETTKNFSMEKINGVRLFEQWCKKSPSDPLFQGRFKFIPSAVNTEEFGIPSYIAAYNGKPVLIKRVGVTGTLYNHFNHVHGGLMEFDINLHGKHNN
jgi:hypothetical protein